MIGTWINFLVSPLLRGTGLVPFHDNSSMDPYESGVYRGYSM